MWLCANVVIISFMKFGPGSFNHYFLPVRWRGGSGDCQLNFSTQLHSGKPFRWITYSWLVGPFLFPFFCINELNNQENCQRSVLLLSSKMRCLLLFIYITRFGKSLKRAVWPRLMWIGNKLQGQLSEIDSDWLQLFSHMKAIDFSRWSWASLGEGGQRVLRSDRQKIEVKVWVRVCVQTWGILKGM